LKLLVYTWPYGLCFWAVLLWAFVPEYRIIARRQERSSTKQDARSKQLIAIGQGLASIAAFWIAWDVPSGALSPPALFFWIGVVLMIAGSVLRRHCFQVLGKSFTGAVIVTPEQAVIDYGAYHYIRHPSYTGGALLFLGMGLALANWISLLVFMTALVIVYGYRVQVEERALLEVLGDPYRRYMLRTKRFVPFLF
jgi:protein-S-isoprenylcysteine O-methyltransferase Ste14